jgi:hypothetical protein
MHLAAGWSLRHRRTVLTGWPPLSRILFGPPWDHDNG